MTDMTAVMTRPLTHTASFAPARPASSARRAGRPVGRPVVAGAAPAPAATHTIYVRRRLLVGAVALLLGLVAWSGADSVFANRGGAPASASVVGGTSTYVVQSGDSLWSIAEEHRGATPLDDYLDQLLALHGSPVLFAGEVIALP
jgi:LysM repeat protein